MAESREQQRQSALAAAFEPAVTTDGTTIHVLANVASVAEAAAAAAMGAEGSGLVRTEVLVRASRTAPTVDEQLEAFLAIAAALDGKPITIRTWDVGGDKPLAYLPQPHEANPFLGERGLRLSRRDPSTLHDQLVAVCRAARETPVKVMFPMVTDGRRGRLGARRARPGRGGTGGRPDGLQVGIMIEVPAAALRVRWLAEKARLRQHRDQRPDPVHTGCRARQRRGRRTGRLVGPGCARLIAKVAAEVPEHVEVAVCGDLASQPDRRPNCSSGSACTS